MSTYNILTFVPSDIVISPVVLLIREEEYRSKTEIAKQQETTVLAGACHQAVQAVGSERGDYL
eukprot:613155-Amorphochlora_amoeboformis.AAC.1